MSKNRSRKVIRELLMRFIYQMSVTEDWSADDWRFFVSHQEDLHLNLDEIDAVDETYIGAMLAHMKSDLEKLDDAIKSASDNWRMERISKVELSIIRLATTEILFLDNVPSAVSINEAVELSKKYGGEKSYGFVNGILGKINRAYSDRAEGM